MKYKQPELVVGLAAGQAITSGTGGGPGKGGVCTDSHTPNTSNGAYEVDE